MNGAGKLAWGWYPTNKVWLPIQVDEDGKVIVHTLPVAKLNDLDDVSVATPADGYVVYWDNATSLWKCQKVTGDNLSQTFGASNLRLHAWNFTSKQGEAFRIDNAALGAFSGKINGNPTSTSVVYDNDTNENCMKGLDSGPDRWGRFILHNTTRGNSRLVVSWNVTTNRIATEASTDDWADDDDITLQSQTCTEDRYMDVDLSDEISANEIAAYIQLEAVDKDNTYGAARRLALHPYETYDSGKRAFCYFYVAKEKTAVFAVIPIIDQKICTRFDGMVNCGLNISVKATLEYADT